VGGDTLLRGGRTGSVETLSDRTAGRVADTLRHLAKRVRPEAGADLIGRAAMDFQAYARTRNNLLHATPGANAAGEQRLFRDGDQWTQDEIEAVATAFDACGARLEAWLERFART
jgi:hypothetical protein